MSTTSLADNVPTTESLNDQLDFCNGFWGVNDDGVDVLCTRMRSAARTMEELRNFWKERSTIEEEYARRLAKLAKMPVGRDEIGELRSSIETLRLETDKQAGVHSQLAQYIQSDVEGQVEAFAAKQQHHKKAYQVPVEKQFKAKKAREQHASKAREKYKSDCLRANTYVAQSALMQGKDLEKIHLKLERAQQTMQASGNDYAQFAKVLQETMQIWEQDWKACCDLCQDLEEQRMEFMKDNMWAYANAVATVCVSDVETRDTMRIALEQFEPEKDMENFVRRYGTGNVVPELPVFVNFANSNAPVSSTRHATRPSNFVRSTKKANPVATLLQDDVTNHADRPSYRALTNVLSSSGSVNQKPAMNARAPVNSSNGHVPSAREPQRHRSATVESHRSTTGGDPVGPTVSNTQLVVGDRMWSVNPNKDSQQQKATRPRTSLLVGEQDPLAKQMEELDTAAVTGAASQRNAIHRDGPLSSVESLKDTNPLSTPPTTAGASSVPRDFHASAGAVVGSYPLAQMPIPPNPPKAVLAAPPPHLVPPSTSNIPVEQIVSGYQRPFPGERRSRASSYVGPPPVMNQSAAGVSRPTSRAGYPGIGIQSLVPHPILPTQGPSPTSATAVQPYNRGTSVPHHSVTPTNPTGIPVSPDDVTMQPIRRRGSTHNAQVVPPAPRPPQVYTVHHDTSRARNDHADKRTSAYGQVPPYDHQHGPAYMQAPQHQQHPHAAYDTPSKPASYTGYTTVTRPEHHGHWQSQSMGYTTRTDTIQQQQRHAGNAGPMYRSASTGNGRAPSPVAPRGHVPPPTGAYTDDGQPVLFYVKALYDYSATTDEEFCFQAGDVIAVTDTPDDGWWNGELLDDRRRQAGQYVFPSNFVCLF